MFAVTRRAPYRIWSKEEEMSVKTWVGEGRTLAEISLYLKRERRGVREKLRRMGLKPHKARRGPCDCETCEMSHACIRSIARRLPLPKAACERAWPSAG